MNEFLAEYGSVLRGLVRNEKAQINMLSMLAEDNRPFAEGIVRLIEQHILTCPPPAKLPALYLVDSIIKNVREPYKSKFSERLPEVFGAVWDTTLQDKRSSLSRLYGTWTGVLPAHVLARVQERMVSTSGTATAQQQPPPVTVQLQPAPVQQLPVQQQQQQQHPAVIPLPAAQVTFALPGQHIQAVQQQQLLGPPQQFMGLHQPPAPTFVQIGNSFVPVMQPQQILQPIPMQQAQLQQQLVQHTTPQHIMQAAPPARPPMSPAHPGWAQQQQQQQQLQQPVPAVGGGAGPMLRRSPGSPAAAAQPDAMRGPPPPAAAAGRGTGAGQQPRQSGSPMPTSQQLTSDALSQLLSNLAGTGVLGKADGAAEDAAKVQKVKEFLPAFLKETHPGVLHLLEELSAKSRAKFRDVEFQRNKRRSAAAGAAVSRAWYLTVDTWIAGTLTTEEAIASNLFGDEAASSSEHEEEALEPEDPEQPCCAISGEPFEKFFDQDREEWFFRGAKRIHGDEAERYGVADGSLVKAKCLAEAGLGSGAAAMLAAGGSTGRQQQEEDAEVAMAAAAAGAPAAGQAASEQQPQQQAADSKQEDHQQQQGEEHAAAAAELVKEEPQDAADFTPGALQDSKMEEAAQQQAGTKREASAEAAAGGQQGGVGSAAKRTKLEQAA